MTPLRKQLDLARAEHRAATYPGDLAAAVLPEHQQRSRWRMFAGVGVAAGALVAACVALGIFLYRPTAQTPLTVTASVEVNFSIPGKPEMPESLPIVPDYQELTTIPAKPEFPSIYGSL
jgi:hypothetical protein